MSDSSDTGGTRVSTLELFFDLVFVFTITQLAFIVERHPSWSAVAQALLELVVIFWMYGGYAWLTNTLGTGSPRLRAVLLLGMAAFFVVSLTVPHAFDRDGVAFGWAYLVLTVIHLAGFLIGGVARAAAAMRRIGPQNLLASGLILVAGYAGTPWQWWLWAAAVIVQWGAAVLSGSTQAFAIDVGHFAERHGLMVIIVLGESLVSVALAAEQLPVTARLVFGTLCGLAASAAMWWCYFAGEDERATRALARWDASTRGSHALLHYDAPHVLMLAGVVSVAAGTRLSLPELTEPTGRAAAALLAGGVAVYLIALGLFRAALRFGNPGPRLVTGLAALALIPVGTGFGAAQQLLATATLVVAMLFVERAVDARTGATNGHRAG
ncbi:MAG: low temperature requirement protein A [Jatrophihabitans sp.]|uniref:low temperature requirement protein A n=1 Tax=Jatrophihabitans sp. TaxID=1932789 RepID=UPI0039131CA2